MSTLLTNAWLLTMDAGMTQHRHGWVLVNGDRIAALGSSTPPPADTVVDMGGDVVMPGMVNPHCHLAMSLFRGLGEDVDDRLFRYILPLERKFVSPDMVRAGTALSALESIQGGVTTIADMYYFETLVAEVMDRAGLRGVLGQTLADFAAPDHATFDEGFALCDQLADRLAGHPRLTASIAPHAPYSTGPALMERAARWHDDHPDSRIQIHLAETEPEVVWAQREHGMTTTALTAATGLLRPGTVAAHCLLVDDADIALIAASGAGVAHNARANGKGGRGMARVEEMRAAGIAVGIGTDGPMSGNTLDLFAQFAPVSIFAKILGHSRGPLPAADVIRMATIEGARALRLDDRIGSLEPGKQADLIRISLDAPRLHPVYDVFSMLVYAAMASDVRDVMVAGQWLMRDRQVTTLEPAKVMADALQIAGQFQAEMAAIDARVS
ncbi:amidohydrolase family protein [Pararhodobacter zhoushanensis]|uniref:Amidohydrolase n=1 Tax=Pararhodobacter zhoushanensis TaxID=2479545 RepID=A0ABT3GW03_9RHOB|nr:amidohydrolase [Pararhodobacter zhoushanensis]MCW1931708.1 amidohydrolase [Pararhodobacter zhoushanensis]